MLTLTESAMVLNKYKRNYNETEVKQIRDFLYKIGELAYSVFKHTTDKSRLVVERWDVLSKNINEVCKIIKTHENLGITIVSKAQPYKTGGKYFYPMLAMHLIEAHEDEEQIFLSRYGIE